MASNGSNARNAMAEECPDTCLQFYIICSTKMSGTTDKLDRLADCLDCQNSKIDRLCSAFDRLLSVLEEQKHTTPQSAQQEDDEPIDITPPQLREIGEKVRDFLTDLRLMSFCDESKAAAVKEVRKLSLKKSEEWGDELKKNIELLKQPRKER